MSAAVQAGVLARRNLLHVLTDPQQLVGLTVQPLMFLLLFVYVFGGAIAGSAGGYLQFVLPGLLVQGVAFGTAQTAVGLNADFRAGLIDRFRSLPIARSAVVTGRVTADLARTGWAVVINVGAGVALGFRFHGGPLGAIGAVSVVLAFGFAMGWLMASRGEHARLAAGVRRGQPDHAGDRHGARPDARRRGRRAGGAGGGVAGRPHGGVRRADGPRLRPAGPVTAGLVTAVQASAASRLAAASMRSSVAVSATRMWPAPAGP